ncbi:MAG TPA: hypothetical protein VIM60_06240, partial [Edaphobacter sp.]
YSFQFMGEESLNLRSTPRCVPGMSSLTKTSLPLKYPSREEDWQKPESEEQIRTPAQTNVRSTEPSSDEFEL